jgi:hypothetical protein
MADFMVGIVGIVFIISLAIAKHFGQQWSKQFDAPPDTCFPLLLSYRLFVWIARFLPAATIAGVTIRWLKDDYSSVGGFGLLWLWCLWSLSYGSITIKRAACELAGFPVGRKSVNQVPGRKRRTQPHEAGKTP